MNKKDISPLIATVLLIGFTIVLAALVIKWGAGLFIPTTPQENPIEDFNNYLFNSGTETRLKIKTFSIENGKFIDKDFCYNVIYLPDKENAREFTKGFYYERALSNDRRYGKAIFGDIVEGVYGEEGGWASVRKIYRASPHDKVIIEFPDGSYQEKILKSSDVTYFEIQTNLTIEPTYDCYFDKKLRVENLTYEELKEEVCDDYKRHCDVPVNYIKKL